MAWGFPLITPPSKFESPNSRDSLAETAPYITLTNTNAARENDRAIHSPVTALSQSRSTATCYVKLSIKLSNEMSSASVSSVCSILDLPNEILVEIILYFNARKRLPLADSCVRFHDIVFRNEILMRNLDFSKNGRLTTPADIQQYFGEEETRKLIRKVNIQNVICMKAGQMLNNSIGKATNLVDVNLHGTSFDSVEQIGSFLEPLLHLRRLSIDWPHSMTGITDKRTEEVEANDATCRKLLQTPFGKLTYLSVVVGPSSAAFISSVLLCRELVELRIVTETPDGFCYSSNLRTMFWGPEATKLKNLKIIQVRGYDSVNHLEKHLLHLLPDIQKWTDFKLVDPHREPGFYYEKDVEVCEELRQSNVMKSVPYLRVQPASEIGWHLISECLLNEVIKLTHEDVPETFCSLTPFRCFMPFRDREITEEPCLLKIDEAKRLLKNPRYQISYLHFKHAIEPDCDVHLVASAFPNLTELVLTNIRQRDDPMSTPKKQKNFRRRLRKIGSSEPEVEDDPTNQDSSFKMLVENTPHVKQLTFFSLGGRRWDLDALYLISHWKNLTTLRMAYTPVEDGKFLIEIGKQCTKLERLVLYKLGEDRKSPCYTADLTEMLGHCQNLKHFSIHQDEMRGVAAMLTSLSNNTKLRTFRLVSWSEILDSVNLISSVERLLHCCPKLTTFIFIIHDIPQSDSEQLASALKRLVGELNRPNFQFRGPQRSNLNTVHRDASSSFFAAELDELQYSYY